MLIRSTELTAIRFEPGMYDRQYFSRPGLSRSRGAFFMDDARGFSHDLGCHNQEVSGLTWLIFDVVDYVT